MIGLRGTALRTSRLSRNRLTARNIRFQRASLSTDTSKAGEKLTKDLPSSASTNSGALIGGVVGGSLVFLGGYAWYHFSGAKTFVQTAHQTKSYFDNALKKTKESAPPPNEAIGWLRDTALSYASFIPGAKGYVNAVFDDMETVHDKHREEVDRIANEAYGELKELGNKPVGVGSIASAWEILQKHLGKIANLAKDAGGDILNNHPQLKDKFGGEFNKLKEMADNYGPEAKKKADETWNEVQEALKGGFSLETLNRIKSIIQDATQKVQQIGDEAWQKALEQAQPYLDKSPQIKELVEKNKAKLTHSNPTALIQKIKDSASSGDSSALQSYVQDTISKASTHTGGSIDSYVDMIPGASSVFSSVSQLHEGAQKHGKEAEKLLKETMEEVQTVLGRKVEEGRKLAEKAAGQDSKGK
jgi:ribosomal protein S20